MNDNKLETNPRNKRDQGGIERNNFPLIQTKIQIPLRRSDSIVRSRLVKHIHANMDRKLIIISAPAGYGKTSLLLDFANDTDLPVCWYTIDSFDKDLRIFLEYLIAAIELQFPGFGSRSRKILSQTKDPDRNIYPIVATIVQEIHEHIPEYFILVLEDHHTIENQDQINEFLDLFVSFIDENCHLILTSRGLPALPNLSLLIARQQTSGMGIEDLRFTPPEIQELAQQTHNLRISLSQAEVLVRRTGGWITGLQLTDSSAWKQASKAEYLEQLSPHIYDYLSKQVLEKQSAELQNFLLESSVLDEISPDLCSDILGIEKPDHLINQLRVNNLFIIEYESDINSLRYHDLFQNFLRSTLRKQNKNNFHDLTQHAADYYVSQGEWERAISRYLTLGDYSSAADVVEHIAVVMYDTGRWNTLAGWIDGLPESILDAKPVLLLERAKIHAERGENAAAISLFEHVEHIYTTTEDKTMAARALAMKGAVLRFQGHYAEAIAQCQGAFALARGDTREDKLTAALAYKTIGTCLIMLGETAEGRQSLNLALHLFEELGFVQDSGMVLHDLGLSHEYSGDLEGAITHYNAALDSWEKLGNLSPWANTLNGLGVIYLQLGDYDQAEKLLNEALEKARRAKDLRIEAYTLSSLADLHRDTHDLELAERYYSQAIDIAYRAHIDFIITYTLDGLGNIARMQKDIPNARNRLQKAVERAEEYGSNYEKALCFTSLGILENEQKNLIKAKDHLDRAIQILESSNTPVQLARAYVHRAHSAFLAGETSSALQYFERALGLSEQLGYDHFLVLEGLQLEHLFQYALKEDLRVDTLSSLLERISEHRSKYVTTPDTAVQIEPQPVMKIFALGQPNVIVDEQSVQWPIAKSRDLFFYLLQRKKGHSKEQIGLKFWPEHCPERLDSAFRSTLYRLRRVVYRDCVVFDDGLYQFNWNSDYLFDVETFENQLEAANVTHDPEEASSLLESSLNLYRDEYLQGVYHDWVTVERERLRGQHRIAIENLASLYVDQRRLQRAIELYKQLLKQDPFRETAHRELMRCYYRQGDRAAAIRQYHTCVEMLRDELDLTPSQEMDSLYLQIIK